MEPSCLTLYFISDSSCSDESGLLKTVDLACRGGVTMVQLREKETCGLEFLNLAIKVKEVTDRFHIPLIIDDRIDVAMAADASGVHLGQCDIPVLYARRLMGTKKIIGATAKSVEQAQRAMEAGADYLGVGAIYPTSTKVDTVVTPVSVLNDICRSVPLPVVAIGGLTKENLSVLRDSPISGIAVVSAIMKSPSPERSAAELKEAVNAIKSVKIQVKGGNESL